MNYERVLTEVLILPWAIEPAMLTQLTALLALRAAGRSLTDAEITARITAGQERAAARGSGARIGAVAVLPILGVLLPRAEAFSRTSGAVSTQELARAFQVLVADDAISAVVLDVDSPGGSVGGIAEFADQVYQARARKPIVAVSNPGMASAAYWIGAAASELLVTPSALVGSIGVYAAHTDLSDALAKEGVKVTLISAGEKKVLGNEFEPLSAESRAEIQSKVDAFYTLFVRAVARGRGVAQKVVRTGFGAGASVMAEDAVTLGMADAIGSLDDAIARAARLAQNVALRAEISPGGIQADTDTDRRRRRLRLAALA